MVVSDHNQPAGFIRIALLGVKIKASDVRTNRNTETFIRVLHRLYMLFVK